MADKETPGSSSDPTTVIREGDIGSAKKSNHGRFNRKQRHKPTITSWIQAGCAVALVFITGFYTYYTSQQMKAALDAAQAAKDNASAAKVQAELAQKALGFSNASFRQEQRAYMSVKSCTMSTPAIVEASGGVKVCVNVHVANTGRTPAIGPKIIRYVAFGSNAERTIKAMKIPAYTSWGAAAGPTGLLEDTWGTAFTDVVDPKTAADMVSGVIPIYVFGVIQYSDIFNEYHETGFCYERERSGNFSSCKYGNWFDKQS